MKKALAFVLTVMMLTLFAGSALASQKVVVYGDDGYPPIPTGRTGR